jgi:hypothetical protein
MARTVLTIVLDLVLTVVVSLVLLGGWQSLLSGSVADGSAEAARLLFLFMDVGLAVWLVLMIVGAVRRRGIGWGVGGVILAAVAGAVVNLAVVVVVGLIQQGWAPLLSLFAVVAGIAFLIAVLIVVPIVHRLVKPAATPAAQS